MKLSIMNIGAIDNAIVNIDGITIIAGENNVGKSTIGKVLFAFLRNMSDWEKIYNRICDLSIGRYLYQNSVWLEDFCMKNSGAKRRRTSKSNQLITQYANDPDFRVALEDYQIHEESTNLEVAQNALDDQLKNYCLDYLTLYFAKSKGELFCAYKNELTAWILRTSKDAARLNLDEVELQKSAIKRSLEDVFKAQYRKIGTAKSEIIFTDEEDREVHFSSEDTGESLDNPIRIDNNIYFVESPKIYDYIANARYGNNLRGYLRRMMVPNTFSIPITHSSNYTNKSVSTDDIGNDLKAILDHLSDIMGGQAEFLQKTGLMFKDRFLDVSINSANVSTGLKSIALLEYALRIGAIERGDILVLDEPEINLHPEWQLEYAKAIVELQKNYGVKFIITSHSPFFMRAIECFTDVNGTMDDLNVYRVNRPNRADACEVINVSYSEYGISELYEALSAPLEKLDALLEEKYGAEDGDE